MTAETLILIAETKELLKQKDQIFTECDEIQARFEALKKLTKIIGKIK